MAEQNRPLRTNKHLIQPVSYERADPKREAGAGRLTTNENATPTPSPDKIPETVTNAQTSHVQVNSQESATLPPQPDIPCWMKNRSVGIRHLSVSPINKTNAIQKPKVKAAPSKTFLPGGLI